MNDLRLGGPRFLVIEGTPDELSTVARRLGDLRVHMFTTSNAPSTSDSHGTRALTAHEQRLVSMAIEGRTNAEIAAHFCVSRRAVEFHFTQIYRKLGITRRPQLHRAAAL